jgi:SpoVK/Ycf46/Vps4 family AAA+-type ATPase
VATANDVGQLPAELLRKGRLDEIFFVDLPSEEERREILAIHLKQRRRDPDAFELQRLAEASERFSGAELEQAIISALFDAFYEGQELTTEHVFEAIRQTVPLARTMEEQVSRLRSWAEGRARVAGGPLSLVATPLDVR